VVAVGSVRNVRIALSVLLLPRRKRLSRPMTKSLTTTSSTARTRASKRLLPSSQLKA